jgi:hypothetical protein
VTAEGRSRACFPLACCPQRAEAGFLQALYLAEPAWTSTQPQTDSVCLWASRSLPLA